MSGDFFLKKITLASVLFFTICLSLATEARDLCWIVVPRGQSLSNHLARTFHESDINGKTWSKWLYGRGGIIADIMDLNPGVDVNNITRKTRRLRYSCHLAKKIMNQGGKATAKLKPLSAAESIAAHKVLGLSDEMSTASTLNGSDVIIARQNDKKLVQEKINEKGKAHEVATEGIKEDIKSDAKKDKQEKEKVSELDRKAIEEINEKNSIQKSSSLVRKVPLEKKVKKWNMIIDTYLAWDYLAVDDTQRSTTATLHTLDTQRFGLFLDRSLGRNTSAFMGSEIKRFGFDDPNTGFTLDKQSGTQVKHHLGVNYFSRTMGKWSLRYIYGEEIYLKATSASRYEFVATDSHSLTIQQTSFLGKYKGMTAYLSPSVSYAMVDNVGTIEPDPSLSLNLIPSLAMAYGKKKVIVSLYNQVRFADTNVSKQAMYTIGLSLTTFLPNIF